MASDPVYEKIIAEEKALVERFAAAIGCQDKSVWQEQGVLADFSLGHTFRFNCPQNEVPNANLIMIERVLPGANDFFRTVDPGAEIAGVRLQGSDSIIVLTAVTEAYEAHNNLTGPPVTDELLRKKIAEARQKEKDKTEALIARAPVGTRPIVARSPVPAVSATTSAPPVVPRPRALTAPTSPTSTNTTTAPPITPGSTATVSNTAATAPTPGTTLRTASPTPGITLSSTPSPTPGITLSSASPTPTPATTVNSDDAKEEKEKKSKTPTPPPPGEDPKDKKNDGSNFWELLFGQPFKRVVAAIVKFALKVGVGLPLKVLGFVGEKTLYEPFIQPRVDQAMEAAASASAKVKGAVNRAIGDDQSAELNAVAEQEQKIANAQTAANNGTAPTGQPAAVATAAHTLGQNQRTGPANKAGSTNSPILPDFTANRNENDNVAKAASRARSLSEPMPEPSNKTTGLR